MDVNRQPSSTPHSGFAAIRAALREGQRNIRYLSAQTQQGPLRMLRPAADNISHPSFKIAESGAARYVVPPPDILTMPRKAQAVKIATPAAPVVSSASPSPTSSTRAAIPHAAAERDPNFAAFKVAARSSARVNLALTKIGFEPPTPSIDFSGNVTVFPPRFPGVLEEAARRNAPLAQYSNGSTGPAPAVSVPALRKAAVFDVGDMGQPVLVRIAPPPTREPPGKVLLDSHGRAAPPRLAANAAPEEIAGELHANFAASARKGVRNEKKSGRDIGTERLTQADSSLPAVATPSAYSHPSRDKGGAMPSNSAKPTLGLPPEAVVALATAEAQAEAFRLNPSLALPPRASDKIIAASRLPPSMSLQAAGLSNNSIFRVVPRAAADPSTAATERKEGEEEHDDGTKVDPQAAALCRSVAYASVGLLPPPVFSAPSGLYDGVSDVQLEAARAAAARLDPVASRRLGAELGLLEGRFAKGQRVESALGAALALRYKEDKNTKKTKMRSSLPESKSSEQIGTYDGDSSHRETKEGILAEQRARKAAVDALKSNPFGLGREALLLIERKPAQITVEPNGNIRVAHHLQLDPSQATSMGAVQDADARAGAAFGALLQHTDAERKKVSEARAAFLSACDRGEVDAQHATSSYLYRLNLRRSHRALAVDGAFKLEGADSSSSASMKEMETARGLPSHVHLSSSIENPDGALSDTRVMTEVENTGDARSALLAMRLLTQREALLDEADSLDLLSDVADLVSAARPEGLSGIERAFFKLLAQAAQAGVFVDRTYVLRMLDLLNDEVRALPLSELRLPEEFASQVKEGRDLSDYGPKAADDPALGVFGAGASRASSAARARALLDEKNTTERKLLESKLLSDAHEAEALTTRDLWPSRSVPRPASALPFIAWEMSLASRHEQNKQRPLSAQMNVQTSPAPVLGVYEHNRFAQRHAKEPISDALLSAAERAARNIRQTWPAQLARPLALLCTAVGVESLNR